MNVEHIDEIVGDSFGLWISALFSAIRGWNPDLTFEEQRAAFFFLVKCLLDRGVIKFTVPNELWKEGDDMWNADSEHIVRFLESKWPTSATSKYDMILTDYFYEIPAVLWIAEDGSVHSS